MTIKEHIWHLRRHLGARDAALSGIEVPVVGANGITDFVDNGVDSDGEAHLQAEECPRAKEVGRSLYVAENVETILRYSSPLARAQESERYMFAGMAAKFAAVNLGIDMEHLASHRLTLQEKRINAQRGLKKKTIKGTSSGLDETKYRNKDGDEDGGKEIVPQVYCKAVNPDLAGYRYIVQKGFEGDQRSEHPLGVAERGLNDVLPRVLAYDMVLSTSHQPNVEAICAHLTKGLGRDANELFENAGGSFDVGGGLQLIVYTKDGEIVKAELMRTMNADLKGKPGYTNGNGTSLAERLEVNMEVLRKYAYASQQAQKPQVPFGD